MRISDWSSDVCSSDLGARSFCVCGGPEQRPVTWLRLLPYPLAIAVTKSRRSEQALDEAVVVELDAVRRGHARQARHGHDLAADSHHEARLDEQTSELMSLMRNSYLVFYLNKKKQN